MHLLFPCWMGWAPVAYSAFTVLCCFKETSDEVISGYSVTSAKQGRSRGRVWHFPASGLVEALHFHSCRCTSVSSLHFHSCPYFPPANTVFCGSWTSLASIRAAYKLIRDRHSDYSLYTLQIPDWGRKQKFCKFYFSSPRQFNSPHYSVCRVEFVLLNG